MKILVDSLSEMRVIDVLILIVLWSLPFFFGLGIGAALWRPRRSLLQLIFGICKSLRKPRKRPARPLQGILEKI